MNPRHAPLNALRAFEAAARYLSFKQAAEELHVTPTAISHQIRTLEHFLGVRLFARLPRALQLTAAGQALLPGVRSGMGMFAQALEDARQRARHTEITVQCPPLFAVRWLLPRLASFSARHPEVTLRVTRTLKPTRDDDHAADAHNPDKDTPTVRILFAPGLLPGQRAVQLFAPTRIVVCAPALQQGPHPLLTPSDLRHHTLLHDESVAGAKEWPGWEEWLDAAGIRGIDASKGLRFSDASLAIEAALAGLGVGLALADLMRGEITAGRLVTPFALALPGREAYYLQLPSVTAQHPAVESFSIWLQEQAHMR